MSTDATRLWQPMREEVHDQRSWTISAPPIRVGANCPLVPLAPNLQGGKTGANHRPSDIKATMGTDQSQVSAKGVQVQRQEPPLAVRTTVVPRQAG
jgi:hypothetical protein